MVCGDICESLNGVPKEDASRGSIIPIQHVGESTLQPHPCSAPGGLNSQAGAASGLDGPGFERKKPASTLRTIKPLPLSL